MRQLLIKSAEAIHPFFGFSLVTEGFRRPQVCSRGSACTPSRKEADEWQAERSHFPKPHQSLTIVMRHSSDGLQIWALFVATKPFQDEFVVLVATVAYDSDVSEVSL